MQYGERASFIIAPHPRKSLGLSDFMDCIAASPLLESSFTLYIYLTNEFLQQQEDCPALGGAVAEGGGYVRLPFSEVMARVYRIGSTRGFHKKLFEYIEAAQKYRPVCLDRSSRQHKFYCSHNLCLPFLAPELSVVRGPFLHRSLLDWV